MSTASLAHAFVETYYTRLSQSPELVSRLYGKDSKVIQGREGDVDSAAVSTGQLEIKAQLAEKWQQGYKFLIRDITSVPTAQNNILVVVLGERAQQESRPQQFAQTFVLARTPDNAYYILNDVLRTFNPEFDSMLSQEVEDGMPALASQISLKESDSEEPDSIEPIKAEPAPKPNSWASILAQPQTPAPKQATPKPSATAPSPTNAITSRKTPYSAFLKLSSSTAITKPVAAKALQSLGPISNLQLDISKKRGYVDFPDQRTLDKALKVARVKVPGGRESIEILKRFTGPPPPSKTNNAGNASNGGSMKNAKTTKPSSGLKA